MTPKHDLLKHLPSRILARIAVGEGDTISVSIEEYARTYQRIAQLEAALKKQKQRSKR